jgi:carboxypeptidase PM20D1
MVEVSIGFLLTVLALVIGILGIITGVRFYALSRIPKDRPGTGGSINPIAVPSDPLDDSSFHRFRMALAMPTITPGDGKTQDPWLRRFQEFLQEEYQPLLDQVELSVPDDFRFWFRWPGTNPGAKPVLFLSHYDVVPVEGQDWTFEPFEAQLDQGYIYARGTIDTKITLISLMEALQALALQGFKPTRDIYVAFGGDEERNGIRGAQKIAKEFAEKGLVFDWILDEGSGVIDGGFASARVPLALVGVEEKGYTNLQLTVMGQEGHSSSPPEDQIPLRLAKAMGRVTGNPFPTRLIPSVRGLFLGMVPYVDKLTGYFVANLWLFWPLVRVLLSKNTKIKAMISSTGAFTMLHGSNAENVLPSQVVSILNCRMLPGDTSKDLYSIVTSKVNDPKTEIAFQPGFLVEEPVGLHPDHHGKPIHSLPGWDLLEQVNSQFFPGCPTLPILNTAQTDSRHYQHLTTAILRFAPMVLNPGEFNRVHSRDERLSLENYYRCIGWFSKLVKML